MHTRHPFCVNDLQMQDFLLDRREVYRTLMVREEDLTRWCDGPFIFLPAPLLDGISPLLLSSPPCRRTAYPSPATSQSTVTTCQRARSVDVRTVSMLVLTFRYYYLSGSSGV